MTILALTFNDVKLEAIQQDNLIWLGATQIGLALGYANPETAITKLYNRNSDEFRDDMTKLVEMNTSGGLQKIRIFSLRGCHLIGFLAKTTIAKQFRKWALDVLDKEVGAPVAKTHKSEREPLTNAVNMLVAKTKHLNYSDAYKLVHQRFNVQHIDEIPFDSIPVAVEYVHHLIALYSNADREQFSHADLQNLHALATHMIWCREWWRTFGDSIRAISPTMAGAVHDHFKDGASIAWSFVDQSKKDGLKHAVTDYEWLLPWNQRRQYVR